MTNPNKPTQNEVTTSKESAPSANFIRHIVAEDLASNRHAGRIQTRFPPEPNGYLHIGHAKSICLNFGIAAENGGQCNLRFDDTNPAKESQEFVDAIKENINWLGFNWSGEVRYSSSYFEQLYGFAVQLIEKGLAYVCDLSADEAREYRGTLTEPGRNSPHRERSIAENLSLFTRMREGEFVDGLCSLRAKIDMSSPNINMRDPVLYRIRHIRHHQTGDAWCIYPTYDYTHCISDAIEGVTHSLCTLEFEDHRPLYDWILNSLDLESIRQVSDLSSSDSPYVLPQQTEFAKLKINYTVVGKRKLKQLVDEGLVLGWDDPRMSTLAGMRRRGYTAASLRNFCESVGVARSESQVDISMLEHALREDLDNNAPRAMCVLRPLRVTLTNLPEAIELSLQNHPKREEMGRRTVPLTPEIVIDRDDFREETEPGFKRLVNGGEVRLRGAYVIRCDELVRDADGEIAELRCSVDLATLGKNPEGRKVKGVIHWVSATDGVPATVRLYDRLFTVANPESKDVEDFRTLLNPDSLRVLEGCLVEPAAASADSALSFQFEREGYFTRDTVDSTNAALVFNQTIGLRASH